MATFAFCVPVNNLRLFSLILVPLFSQDTILISCLFFGDHYITSIQTSASGAGFSNLSAAQAANLTVLATNASPTFSLTTSSGTSDTLTATLQALTTASDNTQISLTGLTVTGFEYLNVAAKSGIKTAMASAAPGTADQISFTAASNLKSIVVTGDSDVEVNLANATAVSTLDLSGLTGNTTGAGITLAANTVALTVTGTANTDFVTLATAGTNGTTSVNTAAGNDTVTGTLAQVAAQTVSGGLGTDTLVLSDVSLGTVSDNSFQNVTGFEKLTLSSTNNYNLTAGGFFNTAFPTGVTLTGATATAGQTAVLDLSSYNQAATATLVTSSINTASAISLKGGSGADTLTVTAAGYTGVAGGLVINGGAGADTISWSDIQTGVAGASVITGGPGADTISHTSTGAASAFAATTYVTTGNTDSTVAAYDKISGFVLGAGGTTNSDFIDLADTATVASTVAAGTASGVTNVTYGVTAPGLLAFAGTGAADLTIAQCAAIALLAAPVDGNEVVFVRNSNSYLFHHDIAAGDQLIQLTGVTATGVSVTTTATAGYVYAV